MNLFLAIGLIAGAAVLFFIVGFMVRKTIAEKKIGSAEIESKRIIEDAKKAAETAKKEKLNKITRTFVRVFLSALRKLQYLLYGYLIYCYIECDM